MSANRLRAARDKLAKQLLLPDEDPEAQQRRTGVAHGVGIGKKSIDGLITDEPCIVCYVDKKIPENDLEDEDLIPETVNGIPTDVIEINRFRTRGDELGLGRRAVRAPSKCSQNRKRRLRPLIAGTSIGMEYADPGTIGALVTRKDPDDPNWYILSCNHVLSDFNQAPLNAPIFQPGVVVDGGTYDDAIGVLVDWEPLVPGENYQNYMDAAIGAIHPSIDIFPERICSVSEILGTVSDVQPGTTIVAKHGRSTGLTYGFVSSYEAVIFLERSVGPFVERYFFRDQIIVLPTEYSFAVEGDSGSLIVTTEPFGYVVGMIIATGLFTGRNRRDGVCVTPIRRIIERFNLGSLGLAQV